MKNSKDKKPGQKTLVFCLRPANKKIEGETMYAE